MTYSTDLTFLLRHLKQSFMFSVIFIYSGLKRAINILHECPSYIVKSLLTTFPS